MIVRSSLTISAVVLTFEVVCRPLTSSVLFRRLLLLHVRVIYVKFTHLLNECILTYDIWTFIENNPVSTSKFFTWIDAKLTWFEWAAIRDYNFLFPVQTFHQLADVISVMAIHFKIQIFNLLFAAINRFNVADTLDTWLKPNAWLWLLSYIFIFIVAALATPEWFLLINRILCLKKLVSNWYRWWVKNDLIWILRECCENPLVVNVILPFKILHVIINSWWVFPVRLDLESVF